MCVILYMSSENKLTDVTERRTELNPLVQVRNATVLGCNVLLYDFEKSRKKHVLEVDFFRGDILSELYALFTNSKGDVGG